MPIRERADKRSLSTPCFFTARFYFLLPPCATEAIKALLIDKTTPGGYNVAKTRWGGQYEKIS